MGYSCHACKVEGVRLWRRYCSGDLDLYCVDCAEKDQGKECKLRELNKPGFTTDQIGWLVPAVPLFEDEAGYSTKGNTYAGYGAVSDRGVKWWYDLPLKGNIDNVK